MDRAINSIVAEYRDRLEKKGIAVKKIILYGSQAIGTTHKDSDIDLAVISDDFKEMDLFERLSFLGRMRVGLRRPMEIIGLTEEEYDRPPTSFIRDEVKAKGIVIR